MTKSLRTLFVRATGVSFFAAAVLAMLTLGAPNILASDDKPVVIELFTSQGCSSCPPADAILTKLAKRDGVIALSFHVDYWDYIGWKDENAIPVSNERQRAYARRMDLRYVYTPQVVVNGVEQAVGSKLAEIDHCIAEVKDQVRLDLARDGEVIMVRGSEDGQIARLPMDVLLVSYTPWTESHIKRGENHGRKLGYTNSVRAVYRLGQFDGQTHEFQLPKLSHPDAVVLLQEPGHGPIHGALRLN